VNRFIAIIPARGGSKGIPFKNMRPLAGMPLIGHSIRAALGAQYITRVIVSTDSREIADYATQSGVPTGRLRPEHLADDTAPTVDVVRYELDRHVADTGEQFDHVVLLQPTSPFRTAADLDAAAAAYLSSGAASLISVCDVGSGHPDYMYRIRGNTLEKLLAGTVGIPRQSLERICLRNGAIYITALTHFNRTGALVCAQPSYYLMDRRSSINIDDSEDLLIAQALWRR
jgi:CMP-N,N'-diacetyllegionaminic acid synthase